MNSLEEKYWVITNQDEDLLLFGWLFQSYDEAARHATEHMVGTTNWRVVPIKIYKVL